MSGPVIWLTGSNTLDSQELMKFFGHDIQLGDISEEIKFYPIPKNSRIITTTFLHSDYQRLIQGVPEGCEFDGKRLGSLGSLNSEFVKVPENKISFVWLTWYVPKLMTETTKFLSWSGKKNVAFREESFDELNHIFDMIHPLAEIWLMLTGCSEFTEESLNLLDIELAERGINRSRIIRLTGSKEGYSETTQAELRNLTEMIIPAFG